MVRHDLQSMPVDELALHEHIGANPAEPAEHVDEFDARFHSSPRLMEYYIQVVAEIRASLDRMEAEESESLQEVGG